MTKERLDWFNFETKSRQTTQKLIQPILDQLAEDKKQFLNIYKENNHNDERLKLLEYAVFETGNKQTVIDKIYDKISNIEQDRKKDQARLAHYMKNLETSLTEALDIFNIVKTDVDNIKKKQETIEANQDFVNESIFQMKEHINFKNDEIQQNIEERFSSFQNKITDVHNLIVYQGTLIDQASNDNFKTQITSLKLNQAKLLRDVEMLNQEKADKSAVEENSSNINQIILEHSRTLEDNKNHSLTIENFMEKYLPIKIQSQISDTVKAVTDKKSRKNLDLYEQHKYEELHSAILEDNGDPTIMTGLKRLATMDSKSVLSKQLNTSKTLPNQVKLGFQSLKTNDFDRENNSKSKKILSSKQTLIVSRGYDELGEIQEIATSNLEHSQIEEKEHETNSEMSRIEGETARDERTVTEKLEKSRNKNERTTTEFTESKENEEDEPESSDDSNEKIKIDKIINLIDIEVRKRLDLERNYFTNLINEVKQKHSETDSKVKETHEYVVNLHSIIDGFQSKIEQILNQFQQKYNKDIKQIKSESHTFQTRQENLLNKLKSIDTSENKEEILSNITLNPSKTFYLSTDSRSKPNTAIHFRNLSTKKTTINLESTSTKKSPSFLSSFKSKLKSKMGTNFTLNEINLSKNKGCDMINTASNLKSIYSPQATNGNLDSYLSVKALKSFDNRDENYLPLFDKKVAPMNFISKIK